MKKKINKNKVLKELEKEEKVYRKKIKKAKPKQKKKLLRDTDKDGLTDYEEMNIYGTDSLNPDTDGDGMNDGEEVKRGRNPLGKGRLKDLFIPHSGNNYQPHALSKRRVIFHAIGAITAKLVIVLFLFVFPATAWMTPDLAAKESKEVIALTNSIRSGLGLSPLTEERKLNQSAFGKAGDMLARQYFAHTDAESRGLEYWINKFGYAYTVAGENLSMGYAAPEEMVEAWKQSPTNYKNIKDNLFKDIGVAIVSGPFEGVDTVFAVQHFGRPKQSAESVSPAKVITSEESKLADERLEPKPKEIAKIEEKAKIEIISTPDESAKIIIAEAELPREVKSAVVNIKEEQIELQKQENNTWTGEKVITKKEEKEITRPLVPATIDLENNSGKTETAGISWQNIHPKKITRAEQYEIYKHQPTGAMNTILNISSIYFKILIGIVSASLFLSIFIEIKKQHPHLILRSVGFIALLIIFIIF